MRRIAVVQAILPSKNSRKPYPKENILHYWIEDKGTFIMKGDQKIPDNFTILNKGHFYSHREKGTSVLCLTGRKGGLTKRWHGAEGYSGLYEVVISICMAVAIDYKAVKIRQRK